MQLSTIKSAIIGIAAAAAVIAMTGAASGSGIGAVFNLGQTNKVNATSSLTGSTRHSMLSVTNKGAGTALSLQVARGKPPFSVNSSARVANLNASLLDGLAASSLVKGGGQSRSFGFLMPTATAATKELLSVPGFGTLNAFCESGGGGLAEVTFQAGSHVIDRFIASIESNSTTSIGSNVLTPPHVNWLFAEVSATGVSSVWERQILRYTTGSAASLTTHMATVDIMVNVNGANCNFDATAQIGPGVTGP
jgi:hypothetical protein